MTMSNETRVNLFTKFLNQFSRSNLSDHVNITDSHGRTSLWLASFYGQIRVMKVLLAAGANFNIRDYLGQTPLWIASYWGRVDAVKVLLAAGADFNICDNLGKTPLSITTNDEIRQILSSKCVSQLKNSNQSQFKNSNN